MIGRPVWLASVSMRDSLARLVPTGRWSPRQRAKAENFLERLLRGIGDESREVLFRMNVTLCRHRGLSDDEEAGLGEDFHSFRAADTAGTSVELMWARGVSGEAIMPCERPGRIPLPDTDDPDLWLPDPCGACGPCLTRSACAA